MEYSEPKNQKKWYDSTTVQLGILMAISGMVPLVIELIKALTSQAVDPTITASAIGAFVLGCVSVYRRFLLDGETPPAALQ
jgi:hypothetical protein